MTKQPSDRTERKPALRHGRLWIVLLVILVLLNLSLLLLNRPPNHEGESWLVVRVVSGQTVEAQIASNPTEVLQRARLLGISAPLREQNPWGDRARQRLEELIKNKTVVFEFDVERKDNSDRLLVYIWDGDRLINKQLVEEGYVLVDPQPPNLKHEAELARAQSKARLLEAGIWDPQAPLRVAPKEFRRQLS